MAAKVSVGVRLDAEVRDEFQRWAAEDRRSLGNYFESLFMQERERRLSGDITLEGISHQLMGLSLQIDQLYEFLRKPKPKPKRDADKEINKMLALDLQGVMDKEHWEAWIVHLLRLGVRINEYGAGNQLKQFIGLDKEGWDCNVLIDRLMKDNAKSVYVPFDWLKK